MKPYYQDEWVKHYCSDALTVLRGLSSDSVDLLCTDSPYGISFMGKDWDKALPDKEIWKECLRVLKPGSFAFVMSIPRSDCQARMIISLEDAGFRVDFSPVYWAYASGFPKAMSISKAVDKRLGAEREVVGQKKLNPRDKKVYTPNSYDGLQGTSTFEKNPSMNMITTPSSPQAKALDGSYGGFQPKPAVEVIIVCMKPLSEKTFVDQALKNQKGITWLDSCRIPYESEGDKEGARFGTQMDIRGGNLKTPQGVKARDVLSSPTGRFPANLLVSDDVLNDGRVTNGTRSNRGLRADIRGNRFCATDGRLLPDSDSERGYTDSGSFSRYFDLDKWWAKTFPFFIVPKASKSEKNKGIGYPVPRVRHGGTPRDNEAENKSPNNHPTVKPLKLMSYLITLGSRLGDTVLDPFLGSGTTALSSKLLNRKCIGIEIEEKYCEIAAKRCSQQVFDFSQKEDVSKRVEAEFGNWVTGRFQGE